MLLDAAEAMPMPSVSAEELLEAAGWLQRCAAGLDDAAAAAPVLNSGSWRGRAAEAHAAAAHEWSRRCLDVVDAASCGAVALRGLAHAVEDVRFDVLAARRELEEGTAATAAAQAAGAPVPGSALDQQELAWRRYRSAWERYQQASDDARRGMAAAADVVEDRPRTVLAQLAEGFSALVRTAVLDPAAMAWGLTGAYVTDRTRWRATVDDLAGSAEAWREDPAGSVAAAAREAAAVEEWSHGR